MIFNVPLAYNVKGIPKGKRNEVTNQHWDWVEIDIPVLTDDAAPIAVEWNDTPEFEPSVLMVRDEWSRKSPMPKDGIQIMRIKDGDFYQRSTDDLTVSNLQQKITEGSAHWIFGIPPIYRDNHAPNPFVEDAYRKDKELLNEFATNLAKLRENAAAFFIVGDDIYKRSSEPVIIKTMYRSREKYLDVPRILPKHKVGETEACYTLDRYDEILSQCVDHNDFGRTPAQPLSNARAPTIHVSLPKSDSRSENLVKALDKFIEGLSKYTTYLSVVDPHFGITVLNIRLALAEYAATANSDNLAAWTETLITDHANETGVDRIKTAFDDFESREIAVDAFSSVSPKSGGFK